MATTITKVAIGGAAGSGILGLIFFLSMLQSSGVLTYSLENYDPSTGHFQDKSCDGNYAGKACTWGLNISCNETINIPLNMSVDPAVTSYLCNYSAASKTKFSSSNPCGPGYKALPRQKDGTYLLKCSKGLNYTLQFVVYKTNPMQRVKWGMNSTSINFDPVFTPSISNVSYRINSLNLSIGYESLSRGVAGYNYTLKFSIKNLNTSGRMDVIPLNFSNVFGDFTICQGTLYSNTSGNRTTANSTAGLTQIPSYRMLIDDNNASCQLGFMPNMTPKTNYTFIYLIQ